MHEVVVSVLLIRGIRHSLAWKNATPEGESLCAVMSWARENVLLLLWGVRAVVLHSNSERDLHLRERVDV